MAGEHEQSDKRLWFWRPLFHHSSHRGESEETEQARSDVFEVMPREVVSDEYGTRPKYHPHIENILRAMPHDAKRLHPNEPRWQTILAPKYLTNPKARDTFMRKMRESDADEAYLYYPLGASEPNVWYEHEGRQPHEDVRYSVEEFEEKYGGEE